MAMAHLSSCVSRSLLCDLNLSRAERSAVLFGFIVMTLACIKLGFVNFFKHFVSSLKNDFVLHFNIIKHFFCGILIFLEKNFRFKHFVSFQHQFKSLILVFNFLFILKCNLMSHLFISNIYF